MKRLKIIQKISEYGIVAVIRATSKEEGVKIVEAVKKGGIKALEITMTVPGAVDIIKELTEIYKMMKKYLLEQELFLTLKLQELAF